jgi:hypothetical protein
MGFDIVKISYVRRAQEVTFTEELVYGVWRSFSFSSSVQLTAFPLSFDT